MNINFFGWIAVALGLGVFKWSADRLCGEQRAKRLWCLALSAFLSLPAILFAAYYLHVIPEWSWLYTLRSWRGSELWLLFPAVVAAACSTWLPRWGMSLPLMGYLGLAVIPYVKPLILPLQLDSLEDRWEGNACLQSSGSTCGPASVSTIMRDLGVEASEREAARAAHTTASGTEAWYLARYVRSKDLNARFDFRDTFQPSVGLPAMVGVRMGVMGHFIAVLAVSDDLVRFVDPLSGEMILPLTAFRKRYEFTGFHMVVSKQGTAY